RSERARERLARFVAGTREREDAAALRARDLADDVRGGAEAVQPEPLRLACQAQRAVADQPRAEQGSGLQTFVARRERGAEALIAARTRGVAAVEGDPGEAGVLAEVLAPRAAVAARAARPAAPRHSDELARLEAARAGTQLGDRPDDLVAEHERQLR